MGDGDGGWGGCRMGRGVIWREMRWRGMLFVPTADAVTPHSNLTWNVKILDNVCNCVTCTQHEMTENTIKKVFILTK